MTVCASVRPDLDAFVDCELGGAGMLLVAQHLEQCRACASEVAGLRDVGDALRSAARHRIAETRPSALEGLATNVIGRTRAEVALSWRTLLARAGDDWHFAVVAIGSVIATGVSTLLVSMLLAFGPAPQRDDSLSALISNMATPAGLLFVYATPVGADDLNAVLMQVETGGPLASPLASALAAPASSRRPTEAELVGRLADTVTQRGRVTTLQARHGTEREELEALLDELTELRNAQPTGFGRYVRIREVRLVATAGVTAKGPT